MDCQLIPVHDCRQNVVEAQDTGETVCLVCGAVLEESVVEERKGEDNCFLATIPIKNRTTMAQTLNGGGRLDGTYFRLRKMDSLDWSRRDATFAGMHTLESVCNRMSVPIPTMRRAIQIFKKAWNVGCPRSVKRSLAAGSVYVACREAGITRSITDVRKACGLSNEKIWRAVNTIMWELDIRPEQYGIDTYVSRIANGMEISWSVRVKALEHARRCSGMKFCDGRNPMTVAATCVWLAGREKFLQDEPEILERIACKKMPTIKEFARMMEDAFGMEPEPLEVEKERAYKRKAWKFKQDPNNHHMKAQSVRACIECGNEFEVSYKHRKVCSPECVRARIVAHCRARNRRKAKKTCVLCGNEFETSFKHKKMCSPECVKVRKAAYNRTRWEKKNERISKCMSAGMNLRCRSNIESCAVSSVEGQDVLHASRQKRNGETCTAQTLQKEITVKIMDGGPKPSTKRRRRKATAAASTKATVATRNSARRQSTEAKPEENVPNVAAASTGMTVRSGALGAAFDLADGLQNAATAPKQACACTPIGTPVLNNVAFGVQRQDAFTPIGTPCLG